MTIWEMGNQNDGKYDKLTPFKFETINLGLKEMH